LRISTVENFYIIKTSLLVIGNKYHINSLVNIFYLNLVL
jgi:hypothetical protein